MSDLDVNSEFFLITQAIQEIIPLRTRVANYLDTTLEIKEALELLKGDIDES